MLAGRIVEAAELMKITEIATLPVAVGRDSSRGHGGGYSEGYSEDYRFAVIIVLVRTDEGLTGIGEASLAGQGRGVLGILDHFSELLVGQDPGKIEHWWSELTRGTFWSNGQVIMSAVAGIDIALWDLKGKALGVPVSSLLGGPTRDRVRVYVHLKGQTADELIEDGLAAEGGRVHRAPLRRSRRARSPPGTRKRRSWRRSRAPRRSETRSATTSTC